MAQSLLIVEFDMISLSCTHVPIHVSFAFEKVKAAIAHKKLPADVQSLVKTSSGVVFRLEGRWQIYVNLLPLARTFPFMFVLRLRR